MSSRVAESAEDALYQVHESGMFALLIFGAQCVEREARMTGPTDPERFVNESSTVALESCALAKLDRKSVV